MVPVTSGPGWLEEPRLTTTGVTLAGAEAFGRALAVTHAAGALAFGAAPPGWDGRAQMGRSDIRLRPHARLEEGEPRRWGEFYAEDRILPYLQPSRDNGRSAPAGPESSSGCANACATATSTPTSRPSCAPAPASAARGSR